MLIRYRETQSNYSDIFAKNQRYSSQYLITAKRKAYVFNEASLTLVEESLIILLLENKLERRKT